MQKLHFCNIFYKLTCLSFLGDNLENIWYTTILAFGREYAYSLAGIECCQPVSATVNWNDSIHLKTKYSFKTLKMCHLWLISLCEKKIALHIKFLLVCIISTFSESFIQFNHLWPKLWLQT